MSICDHVLTFIKLDTGALYKKLSNEHNSCIKHPISGSHKDKHQFLSILPIPLEHECNAVLEISIQYWSTNVSFVKINAVQAILYFKGKIKLCPYFLHFYPTCIKSNTGYGQLNILAGCELCENWQSENHTVLRNIKKFPSILPTFEVQCS